MIALRFSGHDCLFGYLVMEKTVQTVSEVPVCGLQLDEALLTRILKSDPDAPMSPDDLAEVAVASFGRNQNPSVLQDPVQQRHADPVRTLFILLTNSAYLCLSGFF